MTRAPAELEKRLITGYRRQAERYALAQRIVEEQVDDVFDPVASESWVNRLGSVLREVAALDADLAGDKDAWRKAGFVAGPELNALLELIAATIQHISQGIDRHLTTLMARRDRLLPEIDGFIRQRKMMQAYGTRSSSVRNTA